MKYVVIIGVVGIISIVGGTWLSNNLATQAASDSGNPVISTKGLHYHAEIKIYIQGEEQEVPAGIGLVGGHRPMHTHDTDGVIHLEYGGIVYADDLSVGSFFDVWGEQFDANQIFEYTNGPDGTVSMTVNGQENAEYDRYRIADGDNIVISYE